MLKLSKEHEIPKKHVTPLEAMMLVALHNKNVGGNPVEVVKDSIKDSTTQREVETDIEHDEIVKDPKTGAKSIVTTKGKKKDIQRVTDDPPRTDDQEVARLRRMFGAKKVKEMLIEVRTFPTDFDDAIKRGVSLELPESKLAEKKII